MPLLISVADLRDATGFGDIEDVNKAMRSAIGVATATLESRLRCDFARVTVVDEHFVQASLRSGFSGPSKTALKLGQGMVDSGETIQVYAASTAANLDDSSKRTDLQAIQSGSSTISVVRFNYDSGEMFINDYSLNNCYIRTTYTAGMVSDGGDPEVYLAVPDWLQQACVLETGRRMDAMNVFPRTTRRTEEERQDTENIEKQLNDLLLGHARYMPMAHKVEISTTTAVP